MSEVIQYQGRKARRSGSELRRRAILEAALRIIISDGVRSVRHRAVAREADVPLSATTYYFKDITDLIADTFTLFAEQSLERVIGPFRDQVYALVDAPVSEGGRSAMLERLVDVTSEYMLAQARDMRDHMVAERAFMLEAVLDPRLRPLAQRYKQAQIDVLVSLCERLGTRQPAQDAELVYAALISTEQDLLVEGEALTPQMVRERVAHLAGNIFGNP